MDSCFKLFFNGLLGLVMEYLKKLWFGFYGCWVFLKNAYSLVGLGL